MTIPEYATQIGLTKQSVYKKLSANGIAPSELLDSEGNLTENGLAILSSFYPVSRRSDTVKPAAPKTQKSSESIEKINMLEERMAKLEEQNAKIMEEKASIESERIHLIQIIEQTIQSQNKLIDALFHR